MVIVATSDVHLGYENAEKAAFDCFLDTVVRDDPTVTHLVLIGDIVDMWRRDASGVFLENRDTFNRLIEIQKRIPVHYVAGNHDFHGNKLKNSQKTRYPFDFVHEDCGGAAGFLVAHDCLRLGEEGRNYRFVHGHQFDAEQSEVMSEALCRVMSDGAGDFESGLWAAYTRDWGELKYFFSVLFLFTKRNVRKTGERLLSGPGSRLKDTLDSVEQGACNAVTGDEILVFGHTHHPFISGKKNVINTGSWVTGEGSSYHNTWVRLEPAGPRVFALDIGEITDRIRKDCKKAP
ncbi:MAG: metallophosphoesterase [Methanoregula sp.]|jgi:UDP-2,3-diacylglucosamine pyrophosphatase LpxH|uniref:UDP-2,3-diacylglucosamine diphosphatase n=1 Tax=Methanoregula sp. TaxID=2052170 RepID=UPI003D10B4D5